jgi:hypothetical protein
MARACGRTIRITEPGFHIRIVRSPIELDIDCRPDVLQGALLVFARYLGILAVAAPERPVSRIVRAAGDPERLLVNRIAREMGSREFFPCRIGQETGGPERLANQIALGAPEANLGGQPQGLATRVLGRDRRIDLRSTGYKQVRETAHRSSATAVTRVLAIARSRGLRPLRSNVLRHRHGQRRNRDQLQARVSRNAE